MGPLTRLPTHPFERVSFAKVVYKNPKKGNGCLLNTLINLIGGLKMSQKETDEHTEDATTSSLSLGPTSSETSSKQKSPLGHLAAMLKFSLELMFGGRNLSNQVRREDCS